MDLETLGKLQTRNCGECHHFHPPSKHEETWQFDGTCHARSPQVIFGSGAGWANGRWPGVDKTETCDKFCLCEQGSNDEPDLSIIGPSNIVVTEGYGSMQELTKAQTKLDNSYKAEVRAASRKVNAIVDKKDG